MNPSEARRPRILLVEDNAAVRHAFSMLLEESGYDVSQAESGARALELSRADAPDLILMDLGLPDIPGLEVTRRLKADEGTRGIVVVALTGRVLESDRQACLDAGCTGYFTKPIEAAKLLRELPELLKSEG